MTMSPLNTNQRRRVITHLRLLMEDLDALRRLPVLASGQPAGRAVRERLEEARDAAEHARRALGLPNDEPPDPRRRIAAVAEAWAVRVDDLRAGRLKAYGAVHADLAATIDPLVDRLRHSLQAVALAATALEAS